MTKSIWHYQLMRHTEEDGEVWYAVHEYYPDQPYSNWTYKPVTVDGISPEEVKQVLQMMLEDVEAHGVRDYNPLCSERDEESFDEYGHYGENNGPI